MQAPRQLAALIPPHRLMQVCPHAIMYCKCSLKVCLRGADICHVHTGEGPAQGEEAEGYGPLRMWPGGLCLSRAIGDFDVGENVLCAPHIQQVPVQLAELPLVMLLPMHLCFWQCWPSAMPVSPYARTPAGLVSVSLTAKECC